MANIPLYTGQIRVPEAQAMPQARSYDSGMGGFAAAAGGLVEAVSKFAREKALADENAAMQNARVKAVTGLDDLASDLERDPDYGTALQRYEAGAQKLREDTLATLPTQQARDGFGNDFELQQHARALSLKNTIYEREHTQRVADLNGGLDDLANRAARAGDPVQNIAIISAAEKNIQGAVDGGIVSPEQARTLVSGFKGKVDGVTALQVLAADPQRVLTGLKNQDWLPNLDPEERVRLQLTAQNRIEEQQREARAQLRETAARGRQMIADVRGVMSAGLSPDPASIQTAAAYARASGDPDLVSSVNETRNLAIWQESARKASPGELQGELTRIAEKSHTVGADAADAAQYQMGKALLSSMKTALSSDPLTWANSQGTVPVSPVEVTGVDASSSLSRRASDAHAVSTRYGVAPKFFTESERERLTEAVTASTPDVTLEIATAIARGMGADAPRALAEISAKSPAFAHVGALVAKGPQYLPIARDAFAGQQAIRGGADVLPGGSTLDEASALVMGGALDERLAATRQAAVETAKAIYTARAVRQSLTKDSFDQDLWSQSLGEAMGQYRAADGEMRGGIGTWHGRSVVLPASMSDHELAAALYRISDQDLPHLSLGGGAPVHGDGEPMTADELRSAYLVTAGDGLYQISVTDPQKSRELVLDSRTGRYFTLDLSAISRLPAKNGGQSAMPTGVDKATAGVFLP